MSGDYAVLNDALLQAIVSAWQARSSASLAVSDSPDGSMTGPTRLLFIARGEIIAVDSNVVGERLGEVLAAENRIDPPLIDLMAEQARKMGRLLGEQLVAEGLLTASDIADILERQGRVRFARALVMPGTVRFLSNAPARTMLKWDVGPAILTAFREGVPPAALTGTVATVLHGQLRVTPTDERLASLNLLPAELRLVRRLAAGERPEALLATAPNRLLVERILAALSVLGFLS